MSAIGIACVALGIAAALPLLTWCTQRWVERRAPPVGQFVNVAGARLHYVDRGGGPVVVLLHGLPGNLRNFHQLEARLTPCCRVIAMDSPGCGYSRMLDGSHAPIRKQAAVVAAFLQRLELGPVLLVGHSMGGAVALAVAADYPDCVRGLVLLAGLSFPARLKGPLIRAAWLQALLGWTLATPLALLLHRPMQRMAFAPDAVSEGAGITGGMWLGWRPRSFISVCQGVATIPTELEHLQTLYPSLQLPVAIVFGRQDRVLDPATHGEQLAARLPHATLHLLDAGHMLPLTAAAPIADWIAAAATTNEPGEGGHD